jgi:hypothetical protein
MLKVVRHPKLIREVEKNLKKFALDASGNDIDFLTEKIDDALTKSEIFTDWISKEIVKEKIHN